MKLDLTVLTKATAIVAGFISVIFTFSSHASPTEYTLDCAAQRMFPSGVPATFTSRENNKTFRLWCNQAGTDKLAVYVDTRFDSRIFEQMGLPPVRTNDFDILQNILPQVEIERVETSKTTAPSNATTTYPLQVTDGAGVVYTFTSSGANPGEYIYTSTGGALTKTVADWLTECGLGSCLWDLEEVTPGVRTTRKKSVKPKPICPSNKTYYFINSVTGEAVSNYISGGSCFDVTVKTNTVLVYPD